MPQAPIIRSPFDLLERHPYDVILEHAVNEWRNKRPASGKGPPKKAAARFWPTDLVNLKTFTGRRPLANYSRQSISRFLKTLTRWELLEYDSDLGYRSVDDYWAIWAWFNVLRGIPMKKTPANRFSRTMNGWNATGYVIATGRASPPGGSMDNSVTLAMQDLATALARDAVANAGITFVFRMEPAP